MNESYKRLEAFGTFRSIMEYCGLTRPDMVLLVGVVTNSENGEALDGVTVTVDGKTVVTDTYESLFKKYVRSPGIVHNGFFLFEGLEPGKEYEITYSCPGFESKSQKVTMKSNPQGLSGENVTWGNIALTSNAPAVVASNSVANPAAVNTREDIVLTFSRNMDKASVEKAFSITGVDPVTLSWNNDHSLRIKINKLKDDRDYTITIDGSIAKNAETQQFLDGDNDGQEGGNYVFSFSTIPADVEPPYITSTTPAEDGTELYTHRPVIRIEYNEELAWNEDLAVDAIVVEDADGKKYEGRLTHEVVRDASVLHLYLNEDLAIDKCFKVTVKGGFADLSGNVSAGKQFKFLSEYRTIKDSTPIIGEYNTSDWFSPGGSGSSKGFTDMESQSLGGDTRVHDPSVPSSYKIHYQFDPATSDAYWGLRCYCKKTDNGSYIAASKAKEAVIQAYVYGDGSNMYVGHGVRMLDDAASVKRFVKQQVNRGWENICWDINHEECSIVSGTKTLVTGQWKYDAFWVWKGYVADFDEEDPDFPWIEWEGDLYFDDLKYVHYNNEEQKASLDDIIITGVDDINTGKTVKGVTYYNVAGIQSTTPFEGINIVVTNFTDGTKSTVKVVK